MGRPSLRPQRTAELLDAFERCIERTGLAGTSLGDVAREAGVDRRLVLHYFGDRAALVRALAERCVATCIDGCASGCAGIEDTDALLDWLFAGDFHADRRTSLLPELLAHALRDPALAALQREAYASLEGDLAAALARLEGGTARAWRPAAFAILALSAATTDLVGVGLPAVRTRQMRERARVLVDAERLSAEARRRR
jgi:AcrR family transcriptional regulator